VLRLAGSSEALCLAPHHLFFAILVRVSIAGELREKSLTSYNHHGVVEFPLTLKGTRNGNRIAIGWGNFGELEKDCLIGLA